MYFYLAAAIWWLNMTVIMILVESLWFELAATERLWNIDGAEAAQGSRGHVIRLHMLNLFNVGNDVRKRLHFDVVCKSAILICRREHRSFNPYQRLQLPQSVLRRNGEEGLPDVRKNRFFLWTISNSRFFTDKSVIWVLGFRPFRKH